MRLKVLLLVATCLTALPAVAQAPTGGPSAEEAPKDRVETVTVTARRREEDLQTVPAAISVVGGDLLDQSYTVNTQGLSQLVPSLYYNSANPRNTAYTIRGLGSNTLSISAANDGIEPGVGFYVDQVYHGRPSTAAFDFTDIEQVEVLRGPQGTLFGKNTADGAIHVTTRAPTFTKEGNAEFSYGDFNFMQAKASASGPLIGDKVAGRISGLATQRDGVIENVRTGQDLNTLYNYAIRGQLLFVPMDNLKVRLTGDISDLDSKCCTQVFLRVGTSLRAAGRQFPALAANLPASLGGPYSLPSRNVYDRLSDIDADLRIDTQDGGISGVVDYEVAGHTFTSVSAWRYWDWDVSNDRDYTGIAIQETQRIPSRQDQYSQEFRVASNGDGPLHYVGGLYFFSQKITGKPTSIYGPAAAYWLLNPANFPGAGIVVDPALGQTTLDGYGQIGNSNFKMKSYAVFGEANYDFTDRLTATLGLRYTFEDKTGAYSTQVFGGAPAAPGSQLAAAKLSIFRPQSYTAADDGGSWSGRANVSYKITDDLFGYASYARGYKSGGLNMSGLPLDATNNPALATAVIEDETNTTWEVGLKSTLWNDRATVNLAGYWTTVQGYQANIVSSSETAAIRSYPSNVPEVRVRGIEADAAALLFDGFTARASVAFADGENSDYPNGPCPLEVQTAATLACNLTHVSLSGLSKWAGTLGFDYELPLGNGALVVHSDTAYRSNYNSDASYSRFTRIKGNMVTNARVGYRFDNLWEAAVFARNLFDTDYITALTIQTGNSGLILGQPSDPRLVGVTLSAKY
ncbi:MAG TPA: TonB-dependent receptor [Hyphomonadaceae bacterium]|nr:TonB-dependent receptor [Hyphomonadaceae bacterium]